MEAPVQGRRPANAAPRFVGGGDRTTRRVAENTEAGHDIGRPVTAHDEDGDLLTYTMGGPDAAAFDISRNSGQLKTKAPLDYEARRSYQLVVTATDPSGAATGMSVTVSVRGVDEPAQISGTRSVTYAENGLSPVAVFRASDRDGGSIRWSLGGRDEHLFTIAGGVLEFREPPDYESPRSAVEGVSLAERNVYTVTVEASGGAHALTVTVKDLDEDGEVTLSGLQPQVGRPLSASLWDEDEGVAGERWQWARSADGANWTDIAGATSPGRSPTPDDVGMYLRATVSYSDRFGGGKTLSAATENRVEAMTLANAAPSFDDRDRGAAAPDAAFRSIPENTEVGIPVGEPVSATDEDEDVLLYELVDTPDLEDEDGRARFTIDRTTGQIRVGRMPGADPGETEDEDSTELVGDPALTADEDADEAGNSEYVLRVRVTDPSTASATVNVVVAVTEVNEPPAFREDAPTVLRVRENVDPLVLTLEDGETKVDEETYAVTDQDGSDTPDTYSVSGADSRYFFFDGDGALGFRSGRRPDFETKSSYSIRIVARSGQGPRRLSASLDVTIEVVDTEDDGEVSLSQRQPLVGIEILATLSDPDGGVNLTRWEWERSDEGPSTGCRAYAGSWSAIERASSSVYAPRPADVGRCLRPTAVYTDELEDTEQRATRVLEAPARGRGPDPTPGGDTEPGDTEPEEGFVNAAPQFPDQDPSAVGVQREEASREVAENTRAGQVIGDPVSAVDADGDLLIYSLSGEDRSSFRIERNTGQLKTRAALDYEARSSYSVVVTATDPFGAAASILVTISVTDEDDPAVISVLD